MFFSCYDDIDPFDFDIIQIDNSQRNLIDSLNNVKNEESSNTNNEYNNQENNEIFNNSNLKKEKINIEHRNLSESNIENCPTGYDSNFSQNEPYLELNYNKKKEKIFNVTKELKKKKILGRKRKNEKAGKHSKFSPDNITRKLKTKFFEALLKFINSNITKYTNDSNLFLLKLEKKFNTNTDVKFNQNLLKQTLREIFSNNICKKCTGKYGEDFNKTKIKIIDKTKVKDILDMTFLQCLEQFRGTGHYKQLEGLEKTYQNVIKSLKENEENNEEYIQHFEELVKTFEHYYNKKKEKKKKCE